MGPGENETALRQSLGHLGIELEKLSKKGEILLVGKNCEVRGIKCSADISILIM